MYKIFKLGVMYSAINYIMVYSIYRYSLYETEKNLKRKDINENK